MFIKSIHFIDEGVTAYKKNQVLNVIVLANGVIEDLGDPVTIVKWINLAHFHTISSHTQTLTPVILFFNQKKPKKKHSRKVSCKQTHIFSMIFTIFFFFFFWVLVFFFASGQSKPLGHVPTQSRAKTQTLIPQIPFLIKKILLKKVTQEETLHFSMIPLVLNFFFWCMTDKTIGQLPN